MDKRTIPRTTDLDTSRRRKEEQQRAWTPVETRERGAEGCTTKAEELLAAAAGLPEDTSNKRGCKSAAQVWMSLLSLCDRMCGSAAWLVLFTCLHGEGRGEVTDISASPGRQAPANQLRPKEPPPMVIQGDFRKVSGISTEIFKQIETVENDHDASTAAALEAVERRGEMVVRVIEPRQMGRQASEAAKKFIAMQDPKHPIHFVEIIKRPGQTLGLYIREGNGVDRNDGVFISRIALETAVYNSGCLKVGDEILAVNLVDVTHMSLDDVVIIMSIPRRLVLATRHGQHQPVSHSRQTEHKAPPVVVIKRELNEDESDHATSNHVRDGSRRRGDGREMLPSRSRLGLSGLGSSQDLGSSNGDLYYNSRPEGHWSYQPPPPPVITHQPKPSTTQHFQPYERGYPKTLESLAEKDFTKVHSFYTGPVMPSNGGRRMSTGAGMQSVGSRLSSQTQPSHYGYGQHSGSGRIMPRSGSDQHLPRVDYTSITTPARHTLLRSSLKSGTSALRYNTRYGTQGDSTSTTQRQGQFGTLTRRHRPSLDYASDTEATCSSSPKSAYYYYRHNMNNPPQSSAVSHLATLSRSQIGQSSSGLRSNSLPRSGRTLPQQPGLRSGLSTVASGLIDQEDSDGALSAPELPSIRRDRGRIPSSPSVFTSDEYRAWLSRTPSTSALYEQIRATTTRPPRYTYSAENIHAAVNQGEYGSYGTYRPLSSTLDRLSTRSASAQQVNLANLRASTAISSTCHRGTANPRPASVASSARTSLTSQKPSLSSSTTQRATSVRRIRNLLDLESTRSIPTPTPTRTQDQRLLDINPAEFLKYKIEKPPTVGTPSSTSSLLSSLGETSSGDLAGGVSGLLWVHLLAGRGLRSTTSSSAATTPSTPSASCGLRDLYCVLECDRVHKARTVMRTGDLMFDWDETFELDLVGNRQLDLLVYSWDPQYRHKLCYKGSVHLATLLKESPVHQLAVKVEPRGTIYLRLRYTDAQQTFRRRGLPVISLATRVAPLFGVDLDTVVSRESKTGGVPGGVSTALAMGVPNVPIIVWRCVEEVERRGLDIIGLYRLCGSATKKRILREAFERNARSVNLSPDNVPDINVITGVLKDYLRELPEPLFTRCLYQMMVDALAVCLPDDPQGNAKLMFSILDCLPKVNRCTLIYLLDHLAMVVSQCNKMSPASLAVCFGPVLMLHSEENGPPLDFQQPIAVLKYLLEIWPVKSVRKISSVASALPRVTPTVEHNSSQQQLQHQQQAQQQVQQQLQGTLGRTGLPWQPQHSLHQQPPTTAAPAALAPSTRPPPPVKPRQVIVSSPGSPSSEESEASPEPINKSLLGGLGLEKNNEGATANSTGPGTEQITPTSSVDTEEGNTPHPEEGEKGVEGDAEASDDDRH
ncbi:rho GTPase-activating protein 100F isoform X3 [Bombus vosnesenskii]|uniref:Rho GTPase-activating protein 100F isoform X3 n=2 Tax=Pyrobombus TaxID=144703 RepID=A0A6J3LHU9_9HYME|nr:rho GTPase-activating protein 100F isoform X3 [Bombus vancouverensis nearcticus]XP_033320158.1 rho GTPase-activating protein 100F isoform X3 [Bombus bifarius]XP_033365108.1 rho GTPase-activating protein 100F isoform X3 [Bombus vosnesenskii]XP_050492767.1 rho GTPase-activating protein 100F isoform X3 [Bombus huntii]